MSTFKLTTQEANIVLVGSFNPAIFHPEWLLRNELISEDDIKDQKIEIIHNDLTKFSLAWLAIQIHNNKFIARTNDPAQFSPLKDLMASIFTILEHTPVEQMGINYVVTYKMANEADWHKVGHTLAPKFIWEQILNTPVGMKSLSVQCPRDDEFEGNINVTISPVESEEFGIKVNVNNHIEKSEDGNHLSPPDILLHHWDNAINNAKTIAETTIKKAIGQ